MTKKKKQKPKDIRVEILEKVSTLVTTGLGLVAALAWNDAIQNGFKKLFGEQSELSAKFSYAALITVLVVILTVQLGRAVSKAKDKIK